MIGRLLREQAGIHPDSAAIVAPDRIALTWRALAGHVERTAHALSRLGVGRGRRVAIVLPNGPELAMAFLSTAACAVAAPLNPAYRRSEFEFFLQDLEPAALILAADRQSPARDVASGLGIRILELSPGPAAGEFTLTGQSQPVEAGWPEAGDAALLLHTSGTTSRPKLVLLTHANLHASAVNIASTLHLTPLDRCLNVMPLFHIHGLIAALLSSLSAGGSVICTGGFDGVQFFHWLDEFRPTWYTAVPTIHQAALACAQGPIARSPLRFIRSSSSALPPTVMAELERTFGAPVVEAYGMTEASHQMASNPLPPGVRKPGSVGLPAGPEIRILDGEVAIRGANVTPGYVNNAPANESAFVAGWFKTGDLGRFDDDGYLYLTGRSREIINRGGEKISPREIDEALLEHPAVVQAVAFAVSHPTLGQDVAVAVVLRPGAELTIRELKDFATARLAEFKVPRQVFFVKELPRGASGKVQRIGLADSLKIPAPNGAAPQTVTERQLAEIWADLLRIQSPGIDDHFLEIGGDSLLAAQLIVRVSEAMSIDAVALNLLESPTIREMAQRIDQAPP